MEKRDVISTMSFHTDGPSDVIPDVHVNFKGFTKASCSETIAEIQLSGRSKRKSLESPTKGACCWFC